MSVKAVPGDGISIDPLTNDGQVTLAIVKAEDGYTRLRLSDFEHQRVIEVDLQDSDVERAWKFLGRCRS